MSYKAVDDKARDFSRFSLESSSEMLSKVIAILYKRNRQKYLENFIIEYLLNQISTKTVIKIFGRKAVIALMAEFLQLDDRETFLVIYIIKLTKRQKRERL